MPKSLSYRALLVAGLLIQLWSIPALWGHTSTPAAILGRYSLRYAPVLALNIVLVVALLLLVIFAPRIRQGLRRLPPWAADAFLLVSGVALLALALLGLDEKAIMYLALNSVLALSLLMTANPPPVLSSVPVRRALWGGGVALALLMVGAIAITTLGMNTFEPDEAHYIDVGSTFWATGQLYSSSWLRPPVAVEPGVGWMLAGVAGLLEVFGYSVRIGRVISLLFDVAFALGVFLVARRLYGPPAAWIAALFAFFGLAFASAWEFRPSYYVSAVAIWTFYAMLAARDSQRQGVRFALHALTGLIPLLAMQVHVASVMVAAAFSLYYAGLLLLSLFRRDWRTVAAVVAFGVGALIGTGAYLLFNVAPVGGLSDFLARLSAYESRPRSPWYFLLWPTLFERTLMQLALLFLLWRRTAPDRVLLTVIALTVLSAYFLDSQTYPWHFGAYYPVVIGAMFAGILAGPSLVRGGAMLLISLFVLLSVGFVDWGSVRYTLVNGSLPPYLYDELKPILPQYVQDDDVIYTTHQLIWVFPHTGQPNIISYAAEREGMRRFSVDTPDAVWEQVQPTVIIFIEDQMVFDPGMQTYMQRHPFEVCDRFPVQGTTVTIYRPSCPT